MRIQTLTSWMFVGFLLLALGTLLHMLGVTGEIAQFFTMIGLLYLGIGFLLAYVHDKHMIKRMRAGRE